MEGFLSASRSEEPACSIDVGLIPGSGRSPGEGNGNPLQYSCLGNGQRGLAGCGSWGHTESDTTEQLSTHASHGEQSSSYLASYELKFLSNLFGEGARAHEVKCELIFSYRTKETTTFCSLEDGTLSQSFYPFLLGTGIFHVYDNEHYLDVSFLYFHWKIFFIEYVQVSKETQIYELNF